MLMSPSGFCFANLVQHWGSSLGHMFSSDSGFLAPFLGKILPWLYYESPLWTLFGFVGNFLFTSRFIVQWWVSEKHKKIVVPAAFWYLSFWGSVIQLIYLLHVDKAPLILSYFFLPFMNFRSLVLHLREARGEKVEDIDPLE